MFQIPNKLKTNTMKRLVLIFSAMFLLSGTFAQTNVISAYNYLRNGQLDKAKTYIDNAIQDDKTKGLAKTWFYRGNIYLSIYLSDKPKYKELDPNALQVAYEAYQKSIEIDAEIMNEMLAPASPVLGLYVVGEQFYNIGVDLYNNAKYEEALTKFEMCKKINNSFGIKDSIATFNAALCAIQLKDNKKAKTYLEDLVKLNYSQPIIYSQLSAIYKAEGDTIKTVKIIEKGRSMFPNDLNLIIAHINVYLSDGKIKEAQDLLDLAISKDPENPSLHFAVGANMDEFGNFEQAEKSYKRAIELKNDYFEAYYNLGALYVNTAASILEEANKLPLDATMEYEALKMKSDKLLDDALPVLETAEKLNPKDFNTLVTLKQLYARKGDVEKLKVIDEKINALKQ